VPVPAVEPAFDDYKYYDMAENVASEDYAYSPYYCDPYYEYCGPSYPREP